MSKMTIKDYIKKVLIAITIVLLVLTPLFVIMDTKRLGYVPINGTWITWVIPALVLVEMESDT